MCKAIIIIISLSRIANVEFQPVSSDIEDICKTVILFPVRSPTYSHLSTTLQGLTVIRAFRKQRSFLKEAYTHIDRHTAAWHTYLCAQRFIGIRIDFSATILIVSYILVAIITASPGNFWYKLYIANNYSSVYHPLLKKKNKSFGKTAINPTCTILVYHIPQSKTTFHNIYLLLRVHFLLFINYSLDQIIVCNIFIYFFRGAILYISHNYIPTLVTQIFSIYILFTLLHRGRNKWSWRFWPCICLSSVSAGNSSICSPASGWAHVSCMYYKRLSLY